MVHDSKQTKRWITKNRQTSYNEQAVFYYVNQMTDAINREKIDGVEADIAIHLFKKALEYDGERWHTVAKIPKDVQKYYHMQSAGYELIRIREPKCPVLPNYPGKVFVMNGRKQSDLQDVIMDVLKYLAQYIPNAVIPNVNLSADAHAIATRVEVATYEQSLEARYPEITKEWDYDKNGELTPAMITAGSPYKVYWICPLGHSYLASPHHRIAGKGCSICAGKVILAGFNDLESQRPEWLPFWDYDKNVDILPSQIFKHSTRQVWWKCACGESFQMSAQSFKGKCRACITNKTTSGENDLATMRPDLLAYWDYDANVIKPNQIRNTSSKQAHWKCPVCGHRYIRSVFHQNNVKGLCPVCARIEVVSGVNDFATTHPEVATWWNTERNHKAAKEVFSGSSGIWWWRCPQGHEYQRQIDKQIKHCTCPKCKRERYKIYAVNINDLTDKQLFNSALDASKVLQRNRNSIVAAIKDKRPISGYLCSYQGFIPDNECLAIVEQWRYKPDTHNNAVLPVDPKESFAAKFPDLLQEWDDEKNAELNPYALRPTSKQQVWWKCPVCGASWSTRLLQRTTLHNGTCPQCRQEPVYAVSVLHFSDKMQFRSAKVAAAETGMFYKSIMHCCKREGCMHGGYFWSHQPFDDEEHYKTLVAKIPTNQMTVAKRCLGVA